MKRISYLETCHPRNLLSGIHAFVLRLDSRLRGNDSEVVLLHASRFTRCVCFIVLLFSFHASHFTFHAQAALENGMNADLVVGQPDFTSNTANNGGRSARSLNLSNSSAITAGGRLFVSERGNDRIKIWNQIPTRNFAAADVVLGQQTFETDTVNLGGRSASSLNQTEGISTDGVKLFAADRVNRRILVWLTIPTDNFAPADLVLGEPTFASITAGESQTNIDLARGVFFDGQRVYGIDDQRILIWNQIPTTNGAAADVVVGQPDFVTNSLGVSRSKHNEARGVWSDGKMMIVADWGNNRVLIFNQVPTTNFAPADIVIGQDDFFSNAAGVGPNRMNGPRSLASDGEKLFVSDNVNNRVLVFNKIPTTNGASADFVIGQRDFHSNVAAVTRNGLNAANDIYFDGKRLVVSDDGNERVLFFNVGGVGEVELGPQFSQGKAVVGKVFWDFDGDGRQDGGIS